MAGGDPVLCFFWGCGPEALLSLLCCRQCLCGWFWITPWKFNGSPLKIHNPKRRVVFQPSFLRGYVKLRGCTNLLPNRRGKKAMYVTSTHYGCKKTDNVLYHYFFSKSPPVFPKWWVFSLLKNITRFFTRFLSVFPDVFGVLFVASAPRRCRGPRQKSQIDEGICKRKVEAEKKQSAGSCGDVKLEVSLT